jgi:hypothetical protein
VLNGTLAGPLLNILGLSNSTDGRQRIVRCAENAIEQKVLGAFLHLMTDSRFLSVDFSHVQHHVHWLKNLTAEQLSEGVVANRESVHPNIYKQPNISHVYRYLANATPLRTVSQTHPYDSADNYYSLTTNRISQPNEVLRTASTADFDVEETFEGVVHKDLLIDIRFMFINQLRASYQRQIQDGELDAREYKGFVVYALLQSLDVAYEAAKNGISLSDWDASFLVSPSFAETVDNATSRIFKCLWGSQSTTSRSQRAADMTNCSYTVEGLDVARASAALDSLKEREDLHYTLARLDVLRAFAFINAHEEAQSRLDENFARHRGCTSSAFRMVIKESQAQVEKAKALLSATNKTILQQFVSHHFCLIMQYKASRYVNVLFKSGVLMQEEARHILGHIEHDIRCIRHCREDKHLP